ncbi:acyltransferase family protein [Streptacidiphilus sp. PAMC 29251]
MGRQPALDGIRGGAVLLVILAHTGALTWGWVGVDVFFALSGFLITTLLFEERERNGRVSLRAFYLRRARRLLPALFMLLAFITVMQTRFGLFPSSWPLWKQLASTLLYLNNWVMASGASPLGPLTLTWSLAQEEQFYLFWPVLLCVMWRLRFRPTVVLLFLAAVLVGVYWYLPRFGFDADPNNYYCMPDRFAELLIGCTAAVLRRYRAVHHLLRWSLPGLAFLVTIGYAAQVTGYELRPRLLVAAVAASLLVLHGVTGPRSLLSRVLGLPPLRYIGKISYGLYLYHMAMLMLLEQALPDSSWKLRTAVILPLAVGVASLSWHFIESKFLVTAAPAHSVPTTVEVARITPTDPADSRRGRRDSGRRKRSADA